MSDALDPAELALVRNAVALGRRFRGYCEWEEAAARRVRERPPLQGLTPEGIKSLLCDFVVVEGGELSQVLENREDRQDYRFYYKAIIPVAGLGRGLFVEMRLIDDDPNDPAVSIVNAHEQGR